MTLCSMIFILEVRIIRFGLVAPSGHGRSTIQLRDEIGAADTAQALLDVAAFLGLVPEEILALGELLAG